MRTFQKRINDVVKVLVDGGVANDSDIMGCSEAEIAQVERILNVKLPAAYREFLLRMGRGAGDFYCGSDLHWPKVLGLTEAGRELVSEDEADIQLPADAIVIVMHQGYQFLFIRATEGDDPPVYHYMEYSGEFHKMSNALSKFLFDVAHDDW